MKISLKQKYFYDFIFSYHKQYGVMPSYSTIQSHFGLKSPNSVTQYIDSLARNGWLRTENGQLKFMVITNESDLPKGDLSLKECLDVLRSSPSPEVCRLVAQQIETLTKP